MWTCPQCKQRFIHTNQNHSCNERSEADFLKGKTPHVMELYQYFIDQYRTLGRFNLHPAKSRIAFATKIRFGYIHRLGKNFVDVALTFPCAYTDNLCFYRIGEVPGGKLYQHNLRLYCNDDINEEVKKYMKMALDYGNKL